MERFPQHLDRDLKSLNHVNVIRFAKSGGLQIARFPLFGDPKKKSGEGSGTPPQIFSVR